MWLSDRYLYRTGHEWATGVGMGHAGFILHYYSLIIASFSMCTTVNYVCPTLSMHIHMYEYISHFLYSFIRDGPLGCFHTSVITNNATVNRGGVNLSEWVFWVSLDT